MKITNALCATAVMVFGPVAAWAAPTCISVTATGFVTNYVLNTTVALQQTVTITCTRGSTSDATTVNYSITANNGVNGPGGSGKNRAKVSTGNAFIAYEFFTGSCAGPVWSNNGTPITGSITWPAATTGALSSSTTYWACVSPQSPTNAGNYLDTVTLTATYTSSSSSGSGSGSGTLAGSAAVNIFAPASCSFPVGGAPANISLTYNSFSPSSVTASTPFNLTCSSGMQYTMDVTPGSGTLAGVAYTIVPNVLTATGTGNPQTLGITATAVAGQPGTCTGASCTASQGHVLTITY